MAVALQIDHLSKTFPGTRALDDVSLTSNRGEVLALLGHNGSGKSTLIKVLAGFHQPDDGAQASVDGQAIDLGSSEEAKERGLRFVHQDLGLIHELNAVDNVALTIGYARRAGRIAHGEQAARTRELLGRFGVELDVHRPLAAASPVERTCVAIARAMWDWNDGPRILVLDEPTAALPSREVARLFDVIREVRAAGHAVIYVSHRMDDIFAVADRVTVLRAGRVVLEGPVAEQTPTDLAEVIAGHKLEERAAAEPRAALDDPATPLLRIRGLRGQHLAGIDLDVRRGEIVGIAGLLGSGRDELPYVLVGARDSQADEPWLLDGEPIDPPTTTTAPKLGIAFVPAERGREGLIDSFTVSENLMLGALPAMRERGGYLSSRRLRRQAREWLQEVGVDDATADRPVSALSGGNQQRVLFGRCLFTDPLLLVLSEPTAGVDIGARESLYELLREHASRGLAVLLASSDTEDLIGVCDRVIVLRDGEIAEQVSGTEIRAERIVAVMEQAA